MGDNVVKEANEQRNKDNPEQQEKLEEQQQGEKQQNELESVLEPSNKTEEEEEITWEVKAILDKKINPVTNGFEFLIEWKNWDGPPTWEPEENCDCKRLIRNFERELKRRESSCHDESQSSRQSQTPNRGRGRRQSRTPRRQLSQTPAERRSARISSQNVIETITISESSVTPPPQEEQPREALSQPIKIKQRRQKRPQRVRPFTDKPQTQLPRPQYMPQVNHQSQAPRSISPLPQVLDPSSSEAEEVYDKYNKLIKQRRLKLKEIVGAVNSGELSLIVKWHGIPDPERIPLQVMRREFAQDVLDFLLERIKWVD